MFVKGVYSANAQTGLYCTLMGHGLTKHLYIVAMVIVLSNMISGNYARTITMAPFLSLYS